MTYLISDLRPTHCITCAISPSSTTELNHILDPSPIAIPSHLKHSSKLVNGKVLILTTQNCFTPWFTHLYRLLPCPSSSLFITHTHTQAVKGGHQGYCRVQLAQGQFNIALRRRDWTANIVISRWLTVPPDSQSPTIKTNLSRP